jgi:VCBS repeat-containing protein
VVRREAAPQRFRGCFASGRHHTRYTNFIEALTQRYRRSFDWDTDLVGPWSVPIMANYTVTTLADTKLADGFLSLREAIALANGNGNLDVITFAPGLSGAIHLQTSELTITQDLVIDGDGRITIDANADGNNRLEATAPTTGDRRAFFVSGDGTDATFQGLTITGGRRVEIDYGGGVFGDYSTSLAFLDSTVSGNRATFGGGIYGDTVILTNATVSGNNAGFSGGGISGFSVTLTNATVSGNSSARHGNGILILHGFAEIGLVTVIDSIVLGNAASSDRDEIFSTDPVSRLGTNIIGQEVFSGDAVVDDTTIWDVFADIDPATGGGLLADNGGGVKTIALKDDPANPALDAAAGTNPTAEDARGVDAFDQPDVDNNNGQSLRDLGAFELAQQVNSPPVNNPPTTATVTLEASNEDAQRQITSAELLARAADVDGDALAVTGLEASRGRAADNGNGTWTFTPDADDTASVTFTYTISDGKGGMVRGGATLEINPAPDNAIILGPSTGALTEDGATAVASGSLTVFDPDTGQARFTALAGAALNGTYGAFAFDAATGDWRYTLDNARATTQALAAGQQVTETLTVTSFDGTARRDINVTVTGANDAATITGTATGTVTEDTASGASGVLTVTDPDAGEAGFAAPAGAALNGTYGAFTFNAATGAWSYELDNARAATQALAAGQQVTETLTVTSFDGSATRDIDVTVTGTGDNVAPAGTDATLTLAEDSVRAFTAADFGFTDPDAGAALADVRIDTLPAAGALTLDGVAVTKGQVIDAADLGKLAYTPLANGNGAGYAELTFSVSDGSAFDPTPNTLVFDVTPVNDAPTVANAIADQSVAEDTDWSFTVPANTFADVDSALTYTASLADDTVLPAWLTFTPGTRTFSGTPPANVNGAIDLKVTASDEVAFVGNTFRLTVKPVNDAPMVANAIADQSVDEDTDWSFTVPANAFADVDSALTYTATRGDGTALPAWLTFTPGTRTFSGTPPENFNGAIDLKVTASDEVAFVGNTFRLTVESVNDAPVATNDVIAAVEGETPQGDVLDNDSDLDTGQTLSVIGVTGPNGVGVVAAQVAGTYGVLTLQPDGGYTYAAQNTPLPAGQTASETFTYTVSDGNGGTDTADIVVTVTGGNPPFGNNPGQVQGTIAATGQIEGVGDFDANGRLDFLWRDMTTNVVEMRTANAGGGYSAKTLGTVGANVTFETPRDLDGDGTDDVVIRDAATGNTGAWIMRNGAPADWRSLGTLGPEWDIAGAGDVDRNGTDDLLLFNTLTRAVDVWLQGATGPGARATVGTVAAGWEVAAIGDLDGNGTDDVLFFNAGTRQLGAWQMGEGRPGGWFNYGVLADGWEVTKIGNFNGTGAEDIGFYNAATGQDGAWSMFAGTISDWIAKGTHDDLDPIGTGRLGGTTDQILWHNPVTGALVTY